MNAAAALAGILPAPKHSYEPQPKPNTNAGANTTKPQEKNEERILPSYPNRKGFVPTKPEDFGDGGAYPEIHIVQYPLNMGKPGQKSTAVIPVQVSDQGNVRTDLIVKQGVNKNKIIQTSLADIKEKKVSKEELALPDETEEQAAAERTRQALEQLVSSKIKSAKPTTVANAVEEEPTYIRYTANPSAPGYNPAASQRVIKLVEAQVDPLEPPKHKHSKVPRGPPAPPVPVLHSPPRKLTVADQQAWKIPPCVSNWVNSRGFIIPLDKRLAADGRGLQETTLNNKFAMLSEALYITERKAIQDLNIRNELKKKVALKEKEEREEKLREMANRARQERLGGAGGRGGEGAGGREEYHSEEESESEQSRGRERGRVSESESEVEEGSEEGEGGYRGETEEEKIARQQRERIRLERRKEREREMRLDNMKGKMRRSKAERDEARDVSEQIALGVLRGTGKLTGETAFDSRLFNQSAGMDKGFGEEDEYNVYSRPLFDRGEASSIYRPKKNDGEVYGEAEEQLAKLSDTSRFRPDKGFKGAEGRGEGGPREEPVQFEKARERDPYAREERREGRGERRRGDEREERGAERGRDRGRRSESRSVSPPRGKRSRYED